MVVNVLFDSAGTFSTSTAIMETHNVLCGCRLTVLCQVLWLLPADGELSEWLKVQQGVRHVTMAL